MMCKGQLTINSAHVKTQIITSGQISHRNYKQRKIEYLNAFFYIYISTCYTPQTLFLI